MILDAAKKSRLLKCWNKLFNTDIKIDDDTVDSDTLFDLFLTEYNKEKKFEYVENTCVCIKNNYKLGLYSAEDNKVLFDEIGTNTRKKFRKYINRFNYVITNFELSEDLVQDCLKTCPNKLFLRYEILHNMLTGSNSNYLSENLPFSGNNPAAYLTKDFIDSLNADQKKLSFYIYSSYLLNHFENGVIVDDIIIKPKVNVSNYGRWYWAGKDMLQNNKKLRYSLIRKILDKGDRCVTVDFVSADPSLLSQITGAKTLKTLVSARIKHTDDQMYTDNMKKLLNIFVHSNENPENVDYLKTKIDFDYLKKVGRFNVTEVLDRVSKELKEYDDKIVEEYKRKLALTELTRRMVNSESVIDNNNEIVKRHRVYLQGHVHDRVILLSKYVYDKLALLPLYTVHDSINYYVPKTVDYDMFLNTLKDAKKVVKLPFRIEEF